MRAMERRGGRGEESREKKGREGEGRGGTGDGTVVTRC